MKNIIMTRSRNKLAKIFNIHKNEEEIEHHEINDYINKLSHQKLNINGIKQDKVMEVIESPVKRAAQLFRERTIRK